MFLITDQEIDANQLSHSMSNQIAGALVVFQGLVRDTNQGCKVSSLEYQAYEEMAQIEGEKIVNEAKDKFNVVDVTCIHRFGHLLLEDCAVWIGVTAKHRDDAYKASRFVIDQIKLRLPIWKKEYYVDKEPQWVYCKDHHTHVHLCSKDYYSTSNKIYSKDNFLNKKVAIIGVGGLGCGVAFDLSTIGLKELTIIDGDSVTAGNLHRQFLYNSNHIGEKKVNIAKIELEQKCPFIKVNTVPQYIDHSNIDLLSSFDIIVECSDNLKTKFLLHNYCIQSSIPLISAGITKNQGQIRTFYQSGCLQCQNINTFEEKSSWLDCDQAGVLSSWVNCVSHMQAAEVIEFLMHGMNLSLSKTLLIDLSNYEILKINNIKDENCNLCSNKAYVPNIAHSKDVKSVDLKFDIQNLTDSEVFDQALNLKGHIELICRNGIRSKRLAKILNENNLNDVTFQ